MTLESIEKLRERSLRYAPKIRRDVNMCADKIQAEIDSRYMLLPVDADGVPIHVGDVMEANGEVLFVAYDKVVFEEDNASPVYRYPKGQRHVKPRTVEDVLLDLTNEVASQGHQIGQTANEIIAKYASELRMAVE